MKKFIRLFIFVIIIFPFTVSAKQFSSNDVYEAMRKLTEVDFNSIGYLDVESVARSHSRNEVIEVFLDYQNVSDSARDYYNLLASMTPTHQEKMFWFSFYYEVKNNQLILHQESAMMSFF